MSTKKGSTKRQQRKAPTIDHAKATERVLEILADPTSPQFLIDVLGDMILDLENETQVNSDDPEIARIIMLKGFPRAEAVNLRQMNGMLRRQRGA